MAPAPSAAFFLGGMALDDGEVGVETRVVLVRGLRCDDWNLKSSEWCRSNDENR